MAAYSSSRERLIDDAQSANFGDEVCVFLSLCLSQVYVA